MTQGRPRLIGLDWGTSALRAYLFSASGTVLAQKTAPCGVLAVPDRDFAAAYEATVGDWRAADPTVATIASGMIGSTEGWVRAPYVACPAGEHDLAAGIAVAVAARDATVHVVPGVQLHGARPNVMRGEETQIFGALALRPELGRRDATLILPGTHSKWVELRAGRIVGFTTYMTGELYAVLRDHSILGRPAQAVSARPPAHAPPSDEAFERGVRMAQQPGARGIAPLMFLARSLVLEGTLRAEDSLDFLSGLLIGDELAPVRESSASSLALIGEPVLCERYRRALDLCGLPGVPIIAGAAPAGLWRIACAIGLVAGPLSHA